MKKILSIFVLMIFVLASAGVFAGNGNGSPPDSPGNPSEDEGGLSEEELNLEYVQNFINKSGISPENILQIEEADYENFSSGINIQNLNSQNFAIYEISFLDNSGEEKNVFVLSYSSENLVSPEESSVSSSNRQFLNFGYEGIKNSSTFLKTSTGIQTGSLKGYVMTRSGSITGLSTNLESLTNSSGTIEIIVYKNGEEVGFRNVINSNSVGSKKDYDIQAIGNLDFDAGDLISVYLLLVGEEEIVWKDVITLLEITTN
jgi:hypothetical protein